MSDFWIGFILVIVCFGIFVLMSVLVVESWKKRRYDELMSAIARENENKKRIQENLRKYASTLTDRMSAEGREFQVNMHDQRKQVLSGVQDAIKIKMLSLNNALDAEDYEEAAKLRDEINELRNELDKILKNENEN